MSAPELVRVGPDEWQTFRDVRLASLAGRLIEQVAARAADAADAAERHTGRATSSPVRMTSLGLAA